MNVNIQVSPVTGSDGQYMHHVEVIADGYQPAHKLASFVVPCSFEKAHKCGEEIRAAFYRAQVEKKPFSIVPPNGVLEVPPDDSVEVINKAAYAAGYKAGETEQKRLLEDVLVVNGNWKIAYDASQKLMKQWRLLAYIGCVVVFLTALAKIKGG